MRKYLAPILVAGLILSWLLYQILGMVKIFQVYGAVIPLGQKIVIMGALFGLSVGLLVVLVQRIVEIKEEDKDDLSQY